MTQRLIGLAKAHWPEIDGWLASQNVDPMTLPMHRWLSLVYYWAVKDNDDEQARRRFDIRLERPPVGKVVEIPKESPWSAENETKSFKALVAALNPSKAGGASARAGAAIGDKPAPE